MFARFAISAVVFSVAVGFASALPAQEPKADPAKVTAQLEKLLDAYNKDDVKTFFSDWAKAAEAIATPETYNALYKLNGKDVVGDYVPKSLKLRKETSVFDGPVIAVFFDAEFTKEKSGEVAANFLFEDGAYKILQVQVTKK
jgi:hypothetical protein